MQSKMNPFWGGLLLGRKRRKVDGRRLVDTSTGEMDEFAVVYKYVDSDESKFIKLYTQNIDLLCSVGSPGLRVLQFVVTELSAKPNIDYVYMSWKDVSEYLLKYGVCISRASYYNGLNELLGKGIIARSTRLNFYWANPNLFFNGSRIDFIKKNRGADE